MVFVQQIVQQSQAELEHTQITAITTMDNTKVFQSCGYAILSQRKRHTNRREENDDYPTQN